MNTPHRLALMSDLFTAYRLAKLTPPDFAQMNGRDVRELGRACGLLTPRTHSNRNRNRQRRERRRDAMLKAREQAS